MIELSNSSLPKNWRTGERVRAERRHRARSGSDDGEQRDADHRDLRQRRNRQELHARQSLLHDGAAGQKGAADRLRSQERHDIAVVRRPGLPDHHRDLDQEKARRRGRRDRRRLLQARRRLRDGTRRTRGRAWLRRARHHPRLRTRSRSLASTNGASTTSCSTSWATWSAAASACRSHATCARR